MKVKTNNTEKVLALAGEIPQVTLKTVSTTGTLPDVQVYCYGKIAIVRCAGYPAGSLNAGSAYKMKLGISPRVSTPTETTGDGKVSYKVEYDGTLTVRPLKSFAKTEQMNFQTVVILK